MKKHFDAWGSNIVNDIESHAMSDLLPSGASVEIGEDGFLPPGLAVQIINGQHRKIVLEMAIACFLKLVPTSSPILTFKRLSAAKMKDIHAAEDAWWQVNLFDPCKLNSV